MHSESRKSQTAAQLKQWASLNVSAKEEPINYYNTKRALWFIALALVWALC